MHKQITIADVARKARVSPAAVSFVLNGRAKQMRIADETKDRILDICREANYRRDYVGRAMASRRTRIIGLLFTNALGRFMSEILEGVYAVLRERDHQVMLSVVDDSPSIEKEDLEIMKARGVDGIISFPVWDEKISSHWSAALSEGFPTVFIDRLPNGIDGPLICTDNYQIGRQAAEIALKNGCEKVYMIRSADKTPTLDERESGFIESARDHQLPLTEFTGCQTDELISTLKSESTPSGIFEGRGDLMFSLFRRNVALGFPLPNHHVFFSLGDGELASLLPNTLVEARQRSKQIGRDAALYLTERLDGKNPIQMQRRNVQHSWKANRNVVGNLQTFS